MPKSTKRYNITKRLIDATKPSDQTQILFDEQLPGFGIRITENGIKAFVLQYRTAEGRSRRMTLGRYGELTPSQARKIAQETKAKIAQGVDPVANQQAIKAAPSVNDLLDRYIAEHVEIHNAASTQDVVKQLVRRLIRPRLGKHKIAAITRQDVSKLHRSLSNTPRQANFALSIISKAFTLAELWGMRDDHSNPARLVKRYKENERERFLSAEELARLGKTLDEAETKGLPWVIAAKGKRLKHISKDIDKNRTVPNAMALAGIRLLLFTGARLSEVLELRWEHVDMKAGTIALPARKGTGRKPHPVSSGALAILSELPRNRKTPWVLPRVSDPKRHLSKEVMQSVWQRVRRHAGLEDVRLHDLRHTVGTYASQAGGNTFLISHLLRHSNVAVTARYVNPDPDPIRSVSDAVGRRIEAGLRGESQGAEIVPFRGVNRNC